jgi:hypothetical protein
MGKTWQKRRPSCLGKSVRKRIARLVRALGLHRVMPLKFRVTTDSDHKHPIAKNVLDRNDEALHAETEID